MHSCRSDSFAAAVTSLAVLIGLGLVFVAPARVCATEETSGLRELASPGHLWLEGRIWGTGDAATSAPRRFLYAAADPYFVDVEEIMPSAEERETSLYHFRLKARRGTYRVARLVGETERSRCEEVQETQEYSLWTPQLRHFFDPRFNSLEALVARGARFERTSTATVATYRLPTGKRMFVYDATGLLREKRAEGIRPDGTVLEGILRLENYAHEPLFPRRLEHSRCESATSSSVQTVWEIDRLESLGDPSRLWSLLPSACVSSQMSP